MATYTPKELRIPTAITASYATVYTATSTTGIMRTFNFTVLTTTHDAYLSRQAGGVATTIIQAYPISITTGLQGAGWWVIPSAGILEVKADSIASNAPNFGAWGYEYV